MLDTVTFDLWNTLLSNKPQDYHKYRLRRVEGLREVLRQNGREIGSEKLLDAYSRGFERCKKTWEANLDLSTEEQLKIMFELLGNERQKEIPKALMPHLVEAYVSPILDDPPNLIGGAQEILARVREKGYKVGLIGNTGTTPGRTIRVLLERLRMMTYFDVTTFSDELRLRKPDPRVFLHTLTQLKSLPESSVHVGDLIDVDVWGARNVGMVSVHFNPDLTPCEEISPDFAITELKGLNLILGRVK
jgi:putative hydrolase of the HAD superfamily